MISILVKPGFPVLFLMLPFESFLLNWKTVGVLRMERDGGRYGSQPSVISGLSSDWMVNKKREL